MFSVLQHNAPLSPMPAEMFECFKKHLPPEERKKFEKRHQELKKIEAAREYQKELKLSEILDSETLMRFAYVPFVVAQLAWDYADTIINVSSILKLDSTKKLCRAVRKERSRIIFGFDQKTKLKLVHNRKRAIYRYALKKRGYLVERGGREATVIETTIRSEIVEQRAAKHGIIIIATSLI